MIRLLVSDIDGTLVTRDKRLTEAVMQAARALADGGVALALTSSRPPCGIEVFAQPLGLRTPRGAFNGAVLTGPDGEVLSAKLLDAATAREALDYLAGQAISPWLFTADEWLLHDPDGDYVPFEAKTVKMPFRKVEDFAPYLHRAGKLMAASKDEARLRACEAALTESLGDRASVHLSQTYYLDITHPAGTKAHAVRTIASHLGIPLSDVAVIGDMGNDVPMFEVAPLSIAMGQSPDEVKQRATHVTASNEEDGWAQAVHNIILPRAKGS